MSATMRRAAVAIALALQCVAAYNKAKITHLSPNGGPFFGGTFITVTGKGFADYGDVKCRFGDIDVLAIYNSSTHIECTSPLMPRKVQVGHQGQQRVNALYQANFEVSMNGVDFSRSEIQYNFYDRDRTIVSLITPNGGPAKGETAVTIRGTNFRDLGGGIHGPKCRFGDLEMVNATVIDFYTMTCVSPVRWPYGVSMGGQWRDMFHDQWKVIDSGIYLDKRDVLPLEVTFNSYDTIGTLTTSKVNYTYYDPEDFNVTYVSPMLGPSDGGTLILVNGSHFMHLGGGKHGLQCGFSVDHKYPSSGTFVDATLIDYWHIQCVAPPLDKSVLVDSQMKVLITVTLNGNSSQNTDDYIPDHTFYTYYDPSAIRVSGLDTFGGPIAGETMVVVHGVLGNPYIQINETLLEEYKHVRCRFGMPRREPVVRSTIRGDYEWPNPVLGYYYRLLSSETWAVVYKHSIKALECRSPKFSVEYTIRNTVYKKWRQPVKVDITLNGQDYTTIGKTFNYYPVHGVEYDDAETNWTPDLGLMVQHIQPQGGPFSGNTMVTIYGTHFADMARTHAGVDHDGSTTLDTTSWQQIVGKHNSGLFCKFGLVETPATLIDYRTMKCESPYISDHTTHIFEDEPLDVTLNGQNNSYTTSYVNFTYYGQSTLTVLSIYPEAGPKTGGTVVTFTGTGFRDIGGVLCQFGDLDPVTAVIYNASQYEGQTPGRPFVDNNHEMTSSELNLDGIPDDPTHDYIPGANAMWSSTRTTEYHHKDINSAPFTPSELKLGMAAKAAGSPHLQKLVCTSPPFNNTRDEDPQEVEVRVTINGDPQHFITASRHPYDPLGDMGTKVRFTYF